MAVKRKISFKKLFLVGFVVTLVVIGVCIYSFSLHRPVGADGTIFKNQQTYLSEKISYKFLDPKVGEAVIFILDGLDNFDAYNEYIGVIVDTNEPESGDPRYEIVVGKNSVRPYIVGRYNIISRIIYPQVNLSEAEIELVNRNIQNYKDSSVKTQYNQLEVKIDSSTNIAGKVFVDLNGNGVYDQSEYPPPQYFPNIALDNTNSTHRFGTVVTDINGEYTFSNIKTGNYLLKLDNVPGYKAVSNTISIIVNSDKVTRVDFALTK